MNAVYPNQTDSDILLALHLNLTSYRRGNKMITSGPARWDFGVFKHQFLELRSLAGLSLQQGIVLDTWMGPDGRLLTSAWLLSLQVDPALRAPRKLKATRETMAAPTMGWGSLVSRPSWPMIPRPVKICRNKTTRLVSILHIL